MGDKGDSHWLGPKSKDLLGFTLNHKARVGIKFRLMCLQVQCYSQTLEGPMSVCKPSWKFPQPSAPSKEHALSLPLLVHSLVPAESIMHAGVINAIHLYSSFDLPVLTHLVYTAGISVV